MRLPVPSPLQSTPSVGLPTYLATLLLAHNPTVCAPAPPLPPHPTPTPAGSEPTLPGCGCVGGWGRPHVTPSSIAFGGSCAGGPGPPVALTMHPGWCGCCHAQMLIMCARMHPLPCGKGMRKECNAHSAHERASCIAEHYGLQAVKLPSSREVTGTRRCTTHPASLSKPNCLLPHPLASPLAVRTTIAGFAFVYMRYKSDGDDAIRKLDRTEYGYKRRPLRCEWASVSARPGGAGGCTQQKRPQTLSHRPPARAAVYCWWACMLWLPAATK